MVKAILGYDIMPGMSLEEYEKWLREKPRQSPHLVWESPLRPLRKGDQI